MRVLVTGASGFLGSHVAEILSREGHTVRALVRRTSNRKFLETLARVEFAEGSVEDEARVRDAVEDVDAIVHSAGLVKARSNDEFFATNVKGTTNLIEAVRAARKARNGQNGQAGLKRFVFVSSLAAVGPSLDGKPVDGKQAPNPVTQYGRSKLAAEQAVMAVKDEMPVTVIRPPLIYGPRDNECFAFFQSIQRGVLPVLGDGRNTLSVVYASDAAAACVRAITADVPSGSAYFCDDGQVLVWKEALGEIERALGKRALVRFGLPLGIVHAAALASETYGKLAKKAVMLTRDKMNELRQNHWVCSSHDTRQDLGWSPEVDWREGTERAAKWYRENGWL